MSNQTIEIRVHGVSGTPPAQMIGGPVVPDPGAPGDVWKPAGEDTGVRAVRWSNRTSGKPSSALWLTLVPYMLMNLAGWALPPMGKTRHRLAIASIRLAGLVLTIVFTLVTAIGFIGVGGYQVLTPRIGAAWSMVLGAIASLVLVVGLWVVADRGTDSAADRPYLRPLHLAMTIWGVQWILARAAVEAAGPGALSPTVIGSGTRTWPLPVVVGALTVATSLVEGWERKISSAARLVVGVAAATLTIDSVALIVRGSAGVPPSLVTIDDPFATIVKWLALLVALTIALGWSPRHAGAAPVIGSLAALAGSTGAGVGAALIYVSARLTGAVPPVGIRPVAEAFMAGTSVVFFVLALTALTAAHPADRVLAAVYQMAVGVRRRILGVLTVIPVVTAVMLMATVQGIRAGLAAPHWFEPLVGWLSLATGLVTVAVLARVGLRKTSAAALAVVAGAWLMTRLHLVAFSTVSVTFTLVLPLIVVATQVWAAVGNPDRRRLLAIPWDVGSFFPRRFHPFAPPAYRDGAVADLAAAVAHYRSEGHPVIVGAHSQGTVVAAAALDESSDLERQGFLTYGSPLGSLYARFFPRYFPAEMFERLGTRPPGGWINLWRPTDPIGGSISPGPDDRRIEDPRLRGHGGYWAPDEPEFALAVGDIDARIT